MNAIHDCSLLWIYYQRLSVAIDFGRSDHRALPASAVNSSALVAKGTSPNPTVLAEVICYAIGCIIYGQSKLNANYSIIHLYV